MPCHREAHDASRGDQAKFMDGFVVPRAAGLLAMTYPQLVRLLPLETAVMAVGALQLGVVFAAGVLELHAAGGDGGELAGLTLGND